MAKPAPKAAKLGRNDPCPCGSGKKYKECHLPSHAAARADQLRLRQAHETLLPKIIEAAQGVPQVFPLAFERFWAAKYTPEQMAELDDLEERGAERFLCWLAFDHPLDEQGRTLVEALADGQASGELAFDAHEMRLLRTWSPVRLRVYQVETVHKGRGLALRDLLAGGDYEVVDQAASRRLTVGELLAGHLVPDGDSADAPQTHSIAGAAAQLTGDTAAQFQEFAALHLADLQRTQPEASWDDLLRDRSYVLNQFMMALPREEYNPTMVDNIVLQTRVALKMTGETLAGLVGAGEREPGAEAEDRGSRIEDRGSRIED